MILMYQAIMIYTVRLTFMTVSQYILFQVVGSQPTEIQKFIPDKSDKTNTCIRFIIILTL